MVSRIAALFVETDGAYFGLDGVDPWDEPRDARRYSGPWPVVAHPPCQRWGRFWHGSTRKPHQFRRGEDGGCFATSITAARNYGGVVEHPWASSAFAWFGIRKPGLGEGWTKADDFGGYVCAVDQKHYGHEAPKPTALYAVGVELPDLEWSKSDRTPPEWMIERYGEARARFIGQVAMVGGKDKQAKRNRTPPWLSRCADRHGALGARLRDRLR